MTSIEIVGKKLAEAVEIGAEKLGVGLNDVEYEIIDEGSKGFLGIGARPSKILIKLAGTAAAQEAKANKAKREENAVAKKPVKKSEPKPEHKKPAAKPEPKAEAPKAEAPKAAPQKTAPAPEVKAAQPEEQAPAQEKYTGKVESEEVQNERKNLTEEDKAKIVASATDFLKEVFAAMNMEVKLSATFEDNKQIIIEMTGENMGVVIGKRGQTLDSLQYLTNLVVNKGNYPYMNVTLDTEGYRTRRKETLEHLAFNLAKKAKHLRKNVVLEPMNPYERRIIHSTLQNDRYVTTYSEGTEPYRYVVISPKANYRGSYSKDKRAAGADKNTAE